MACLGVLDRGERGDDSETGLKEGGGIEMSTTVLPLRDARSHRLCHCILEMTQISVSLLVCIVFAVQLGIQWCTKRLLRHTNIVFTRFTNVLLPLTQLSFCLLILEERFGQTTVYAPLPSV
jgi:hypothetical protein